MTTLEEAFVGLVGTDPVVQGLVAGTVIALFNLVGASAVLVWRNPTERALDTALGFAAGVMLSASFTSLLIPGIDFASEPGYDAVVVGPVVLAGVLPVLIGFALGVALLDQGERWVKYVGPLVSDRLVPEEQRPGGPATDGGEREPDNRPVPTALADSRLMSVLLFTVAITIHNMPEGLAVGVGFGSGEVATGLALMLAIGVQNVPEGLAVSVAAINAGLGRRWYAAVAGIRAGVVEIPLAVFGAYAVSVAAPLLPYAMGFAAGGMLFVIGDEIVPETHSHGYAREATWGLMVGAAVMLTLDVVLAG
jgi:ZIP family zinc transporter